VNDQRAAVVDHMHVAVVVPDRPTVDINVGLFAMDGRQIVDFEPLTGLVRLRGAFPGSLEPGENQASLP